MYEKSLSVATDNNTQSNQRVYTRSMCSTRARKIGRTKQQQCTHHTPKILTLTQTYIHTRKNTHCTPTFPSHTTIPRHRSRLHPSHSLSYRDKYNQKTHTNYTIHKFTISHFLRCRQKTLTTFRHTTPQPRSKK